MMGDVVESQLELLRAQLKDVESMISLQPESDELLKMRSNLRVVVEELEAIHESSDNVSAECNLSEPLPLDEMVGQKISVPYSTSSGHFFRHNCVISDVNIQKGNVKVIFCNPTRLCEVACQKWLDGDCPFEDSCKFSHGHSVAYTDISDYSLPDYGLLAVNQESLVKVDGEDIWSICIIEHISPDGCSYCVRIPSKSSSLQVTLECLFPLTSQRDTTADEEKDGDRLTWLADHNECSETDSFACWERYSSGFGSRMLKKMGYIPGKGLGKDGDGRITPVPICIYPVGKSLDEVMRMRNKDGSLPVKSKSLTTAPNKTRKHKKNDVFNFLNSQLGSSKPFRSLSNYKKSNEFGKEHQLFLLHEHMTKLKREEKSLVSCRVKSPSVKEKLQSVKVKLERLKSEEKSLKKALEMEKERNMLHVF